MKEKLSRAISIFATISIIALLILSGYTSAINVLVSTDKIFYQKNENILIESEIAMESSEIVPLTNVTIRIRSATLSFLNSTCVLTSLNEGSHSECSLQDSKFQEVNITHLGNLLRYGNRTAFNATDYYYWGYGYGYGYGEIYSSHKIVLKIKWKVPDDWFGGEYWIDIIAKTERDVLDNYPSFSGKRQFFIQITPTTTTTTPSTTTSTTTTIPVTPTTTTEITTTTTTQITTTTVPTTTTSSTIPTTTLFTSTTTTTTTTTTTSTTTTVATTTTVVPTTTTTSTTETPTTTTTLLSCYGKSYQTCLFFSECQWLGNPILGKCVDRQATTTAITTTTTIEVTTTTTLETTTTTTTTTIPSECYGLNYLSCLFINNCKWQGDLRMGKCVGPETTTTVVTTTTEIPTTTTVLTQCNGLNYLSCLFTNNCKWQGSLKLGKCVSS